MDVVFDNAYPLIHMWITVEEAAKLTEYHPEHIRRLIRQGKIEARKFATVWQVDKSSLISYLNDIKELGNKRGPKVEAE